MMQKLVSEFIRRHNLQTNAEIRYIDLVSEVGELGKEILKGSDYGRSQLVRTSQTKDEIGDCLFSLLAVCDAMQIDAEEAVRDSISKYEMRFSKKWDISSGE